MITKPAVLSSTFMTFQVASIMQQCIDIARAHHTPFGAALVNEAGKVLVMAPNTTKIDGSTAHAEMNVLKDANKYPGEQLFLITTCEPCPMCAGAALWTKVKGIYFGASIEDASQFMKQIDISCQQVVDASWVNIPVVSGILKEECLELFRNR
ncbi:MAG: nucleoside deaminase [Cytophagales bacterium]|nr:nucleoside deaminase [Cytophagales bacterium]